MTLTLKANYKDRELTSQSFTLMSRKSFLRYLCYFSSEEWTILTTISRQLKIFVKLYILKLSSAAKILLTNAFKTTQIRQLRKTLWLSKEITALALKLKDLLPSKITVKKDFSFTKTILSTKIMKQGMILLSVLIKSLQMK